MYIYGFRAHHQSDDHHPDDGGSKHLRNVRKLLPDYTVQQPIRQPSSWTLSIIITLIKTRRFGDWNLVSILR
jgi:hypothetical protein